MPDIDDLCGGVEDLTGPKVLKIVQQSTHIFQNASGNVCQTFLPQVGELFSGTEDDIVLVDFPGFFDTILNEVKIAVDLAHHFPHEDGTCTCISRDSRC